MVDIQPAQWTKNKEVRLIQLLIYGVNGITVFFISQLISRSTQMICSNFDARIFLERLRYVPNSPTKVWALSFFLFLFLLACNLFQRLGQRFRHASLYQVFMVLVEISICMAIMFYQDMGNKGILLVPAMNVLIFCNTKWLKGTLLSVLLILYLFLDQELASLILGLRFVSADAFFEYYSAKETISLIVIRTLLFSLNEVLFIAFLFLSLQLQISERKRVQALNAELQVSLQRLNAANVQLSEYAIKIEELAKIKERNRLAREIHDTIGHTLTGIEIGLRACLCFERDQFNELMSQISKVQSLAEKGGQDVRYSLKALRCDSLQRYTLIPAIESLIEQMNGCTSTQTCLALVGELPTLSAVQEELIYRIVQESMTNAIGHGKASTITVKIEKVQTILDILIVDDGKGVLAYREGFGLSNIRQRIEAFCGSLEITTSPGKGFILAIKLPMTEGELDDNCIDS
nr:sensor histidine kinase [uncultured Sphaerochaeta sp.]